MMTPVTDGSSQAGVKLGASAEAYTTATAKPVPSHICNLYHSLQQCQIFNHVAASEHDTVLNFTVLQVNYLVKKKCSASGACEPSGDEL